MKALFIALSLACSILSSAQNDIETFNSYFGEEKAEAFEKAVTSFQEFLKLNYSGIEDESLRVKQFLMDIRDSIESAKPKWKLPKNSAGVASAFEASGLRSEIYLWPNEQYGGWVDIDQEIILLGNDSTETHSSDSAYRFNPVGKYIIALESHRYSSSIVNEYTEVKRSAGTINPVLMAAGLLYNNEEFNDPIFLRIVVAEFYSLLIME